MTGLFDDSRDEHPVDELDAGLNEECMRILEAERHLKEDMVSNVIQLMAAAAGVAAGDYVVGSYKVTVSENGDVAIENYGNN
jgi:hypothetical protein